MNTSTPTSAPKRLMLDEKDFFDVLRAQRPSPPATDPQTLDGYLTALIIGPRFIDPRQWIPSFVGEGALMAPEHTTEAKALQSLVVAYNTISSGLGARPGPGARGWLRTAVRRLRPTCGQVASCSGRSSRPGSGNRYCRAPRAT